MYNLHKKLALWLVPKTFKMTDVIFLKKQGTGISHNNSDKPHFYNSSEP